MLELGAPDFDYLLGFKVNDDLSALDFIRAMLVSGVGVDRGNWKA